MRYIALATAVLLVTSVTGGAATASAEDNPDPQTITGIVQTLIREPGPGEHADGNDTTKALQVGAETVPLTAGSLATAQDGAKVSVTVAPAADGMKRVLSARTISVAPATTAAAVAATAAAAAAAAADSEVAAATPAPHQLYVALVRPQGSAVPIATDLQVRAMVAKVSSFWSSQTGGQISFSTANVVPVYTSTSYCGATETAMWNEARLRMPAEATAAGNHLVVVMPEIAQDTSCIYGLATVGGPLSTNNKVLVSGLNQSLLAHELGHNLGLHHSYSLRCTGAQDATRVGVTFPGCVTVAYDDPIDVMGSSGPSFGEGSLNAVHMDTLNVVPTAMRKVYTSTAVTTIRIAPLSATTSANRTLRISVPNAGSYFVEYRYNSGLDTVAYLNYLKPTLGVRVLRDNPPSATTSMGSLVLDPTPTSASDYNRVIPVGGTFTSASKTMKIQLISQDATGATMQITNSPVALPPPPAPPTALPGPPVIGPAAPGIIGGAITATARWTPPLSNGGYPITGYVVVARRMSSTGVLVSTTVSPFYAATTRAVTLTLPAPVANYRFQVRARTVKGVGAFSALSQLVTAR